jgi:hypothetical protein
LYVDQLMKNLDYAHMTQEYSEGEHETLLIVPIGNEFKDSWHFDSRSVLNLVAIVNATGTIRKVNIVMFTPEQNQRTIDVLPYNTLNSVLNTGEKVAVNGQFKFLTVGGKWIYQLDYKDCKLAAESGKLNVKMMFLKVKNGKTEIASEGNLPIWHSDGFVVEEMRTTVENTTEAGVTTSKERTDRYTLISPNSKKLVSFLSFSDTASINRVDTIDPVFGIKGGGTLIRLRISNSKEHQPCYWTRLSRTSHISVSGTRTKPIMTGVILLASYDAINR